MSPLTGSSSRPNPPSGPFSYTCPLLGMLDDPSTVTLFPSDANHCSCCHQPAVPNFAHQSTYCLTQNYVKCPLKAGARTERMPARMRWKRSNGFNNAAFLKGAIGGAIALMLALFFILWMPGLISDMLIRLAPTSASGGNWPTLTPSLTSMYSATPTSTSTDSPAPRRTSTQRTAASASATATSTLAPSAVPTRLRSATTTFTYTPPPYNPPAPTAAPTKRPNTAVPPTNTPLPPPPTNTPVTPVPATQLIPTSTSKTPSRRSLKISILSRVFISECRYRTLMFTFFR